MGTILLFIIAIVLIAAVAVWIYHDVTDTGYDPEVEDGEAVEDKDDNDDIPTPQF